MRGLLMARRQTSLAFPDPEAPQALYVLGRVEPVATGGTLRQGQGPETLTEPEPPRAYAEKFGGFADGVCAPLAHYKLSLRL
jgi:hypothetical protein